MADYECLYYSYLCYIFYLNSLICCWMCLGLIKSPDGILSKNVLCLSLLKALSISFIFATIMPPLQLFSVPDTLTLTLLCWLPLFKGRCTAGIFWWMSNRLHAICVATDSLSSDGSLMVEILWKSSRRFTMRNCPC